MFDLTPLHVDGRPVSPQPAVLPDVPGAAPAGLPSSRTMHDRGLEQVSYLSGRLAGLAGSSRYELTPACRDELAALAAIAECAYVLLEESRG
jgi:hypothetical protein